jgi:beta-glucosidase
MPLMSATYAQEAPAVKASAHSAVTPVPRGEDWWRQRHDAMNARVKQGNVDLIFIGDSITQGWEGAGKDVWQQYYAKRNAVDLGISGDRTQHALWRLDHGNIDGIAPKLAVVMIGTNNAGDDSETEIADGITAIVQQLRAKLPQTKVLLLAVFPREEKPGTTRAKLVAVNQLASKCADGKMVHFLDIGKAFLERDDTLPKSVMPDALHPNAKGYEIWAKAIEPKIAELMGEGQTK